MAQRRQAFLTARAPQLKLPQAFIPLCSNRKVDDPPLLYYGFLLLREDLDKLVARRGLVLGHDQSADTLTDYSREVRTRNAVSHYLSKNIHSDLCIEIPFAATTDAYVVALDDTLSFRCAQSPLWKKKARRIFGKARR